MNPSAPLDYDDTVAVRQMNDPLYKDYIPVYPSLARFIDTPQFQRLRDIRQLGVSSYVWPSATHSRFVHSLGVAHLARRMATEIRRKQPELGLTQRDIGCVEIAGLCHDLGHGPWSHVWDNVFLRDSTWTHEQGSEMMFDYLVEDNDINMHLEDREFVKALISGNHSRTPHEKRFLFDIVANTRNGLDVDKFDYLRRDGVTIAISTPVDHSVARLFHAVRVIDDQICYDIKEAKTVYVFFEARFQMHSTVYSHKTTKVIEFMVVDGLNAANKHLRLSDSVYDPKKYVYITDSVMYEILRSNDPELAESRAIFSRIHRRDLYSNVGCKLIKWLDLEIYKSHITPKNIVEAVHAYSKSISKMGLEVTEPTNFDSNLASTLHSSDVVVGFSTRSYGKGELNPVDFVRFYSKDDLNKCRKASPSEYSSLLPQYFCEAYMVVCVKNKELEEAVKVGYEFLIAELEQKLAEKDMIPKMIDSSPVTTPPTSDET